MLDSDDEGEGEGEEPAAKKGVARPPDIPHTTDVDDLTKDVRELLMSAYTGR